MEWLQLPTQLPLRAQGEKMQTSDLTSCIPITAPPHMAAAQLQAGSIPVCVQFPIVP